LQNFLFLQVDTSWFAAELADALAAGGHGVAKVHLCAGDLLFWRRRAALSFRGSASAWPRFVGAVMDRLAITDLLLTGEQRPYHRAAIAEARARNIAVTIHDLGYLRPDWIAFEPDGMGTWSRFPRSPEAVAALARDAPPVDLALRFADSFVAQATGDVAFHVATAAGWFLFPHYRTFQPPGHLRGYLGTLRRLLGARRRAALANRRLAELTRSRTPTFLFAMQMEADFSLRSYSPFEDMETPLRQAIASFARFAPADAALVVKLHPHDPGLRPWVRLVADAAAAAGAATRIHVIDGGALDGLLTQVRGVVTVNSTVGIWTLRAGKPVLALGDAIYAMPGLVHQGGIDDFWTAPSLPDPALVEQFLRAIADLLHVRGVFYRREGRAAAVREAASRLQRPARLALEARLDAAGAQNTRFAPLPRKVSS